MAMDPELYEAATSGNIDLFSKKNWTFFRETSEGNSALHLAVKFNQKQFVEKIIELHPHLQYSTNSKGDTPLHIAARVGCLEITKNLVGYWNAESGVEANNKELLRMVNLEKDTALHDALLFVCCYYGMGLSSYGRHFNSFFDVWARYLENPIIINPLILFYQVLTSIKLTFTRLKKALGIFGVGSEADLMSKFIEQHPLAIKEDDEFGWTPLHYAAYLCHTEAIQLLLDKDRQAAYMKDKEGMSALHIAAKEGYVMVMKQIIKLCPETCELLDYRGRTALHVAVEHGNTRAVKYVLKAPALVGLINEKDKEGNTALHLAAVNGHQNIVSILADDSRVDKVAMNKEGYTAIQIILSNMMLRRFRKAWITMKLELAGGLPSLKGVVIRENTKRKKFGMKEQFQHTEKREELVEDQEIKGTVLERKENRDSKLLRLKDVANTHLLVATIIATVTFAAGFTMPGGYESEGHDQGMAILSKNTAFRVFLIADTIAFCCSAASMSIHFWASMYKNYNVLLYFIRFAAALTSYSIIGLVIAFVFGTYVVVAGSSDLATANTALGCCFFISFYIFLFG
ncbi:hypothetical protein L1049_010874 [Liquidambar formosana]|uniref:PGG domain-containing protein n=1 Tax=Liquidambar formosana TaxID=63359 RepID=A0AAP0X211_LIQFO